MRTTLQVLLATGLLLFVATFSAHQCESKQVTAMPWVQVCAGEQP